MDESRLLMTFCCCGSWELVVSDIEGSLVGLDDPKCEEFSVELSEDPKRRYISSWLVKFGGKSGRLFIEHMLCSIEAVSESKLLDEDVDDRWS